MQILVTVAFILHLAQGKLVPPQQLYRDFDERAKTFCKKEANEYGGLLLNFDCIKTHTIQTDYVCRGYVSLVGQDQRFKECYCSGAIYEYIEYGEVCTRYSFKSNPPTPMYGKDPVIRLPFNWGTNPDNAHTEDGKPYVVRPLNSFVPKNGTYDSAPSPLLIKRQGIDFAIKDLANDFLQNFYVKDSNKNLLFSPLSLHAVLAVLFEGVSGDENDSFNQLRDVLGFITNPKLTREYYKVLMKDLNDAHCQEEVSLKNDIFLSNDYAALPPYVDNLASNYRTTFSQFVKEKPKESLEQINKRIAENTQGLIENVISSLNNVDLFLVNSLFINTPWVVPFDRSEAKMDFIKNDGSIAKVDSMRVQSSKLKLESFKLSYNDPNQLFVPASTLDEDLNKNDLNVITIPIAASNGVESNFEFRIYLGKLNENDKNRNKALQLLMNQVKQKSGNIFLVELEAKKETPPGRKLEKEIILKMPIFSLRNKFNVKEFLISKGVKSIFTENAQLTKMVNDTEGLYVNSISQEVFIDVSEEGAKAGAASVVGLKLTQARSKVIINVDSPFIFSMWSKTFNFPLVVGLINDPLDKTDTAILN